MTVLIIDETFKGVKEIKELVAESIPHAVILEASSITNAAMIIDTFTIELVILNDDGGTCYRHFLKNIDSYSFDLIIIEEDPAGDPIHSIDTVIHRLARPLQPSALKQLLEATVKNRKLQKSRLSDREEYDQEVRLQKRLILSHQQGIKFITLKDIIYLKADNVYTTIFLLDGSRVVSSKPISKFEHILDTNWFFRIHKSYIVNIFHFKEYISREGDFALMSNGQQLIISRYRLNEFIEFVKKTSGELVV